MVTTKKNQVSAKEIAKYFIWKAKREEKAITNKKLQKLLYYAQAWHLVFEDKPLFKEEIEAWIHGPVVNDVYQTFKGFGRKPIIWKKLDDKEVEKTPGQDLLDSVWSAYGKFDAEYLEILTHSELPWQEARESLDEGEPSDAVISHESMKNFYGALYAKFSEEKNG